MITFVRVVVFVMSILASPRCSAGTECRFLVCEYKCVTQQTVARDRVTRVDARWLHSNDPTKRSFIFMEDYYRGVDGYYQLKRVGKRKRTPSLMGIQFDRT